MAFLRRWLLIVSALLLGAGSLGAAGGPREQRAYAAAVAPFQDGLWSYAATNLVQFIKKYPDSTNVPEAVLLLARAEYQQGDFTGALATLTEQRNQAGVLADQYVYWTGEAQFASSNFPAAAAALVSIPRDFPQSTLQLAAVVAAVAAYAQLSDWPQHDELLETPNGVFQRAAQSDPANKLVLAGQLSRENSKFHKHDYSGVAAVYALLTNQWPILNQVQRCKSTHLLYLAKMAQGDFATALAAATNLVQMAGSPTNQEWLAAGWAAQGAALEKLDRLPEAIQAWQNNTNAPVPQRREAILQIAELEMAQGQLTNAGQDLDNFLAQFPGADLADIALLTAGELELEAFVAQPADTNQLAEAQTNFDQLIDGFPNSPLRGKAYLGRGWCGWLGAKYFEDSGDTNAAAQKYSDSLADFRQAAPRLPVSEDLAVAKFKTGDALFALGDFSGARTNYQSVLDEFGDVPAVAKSLGDRVFYQLLRVDLKLPDLAGAETAMTNLLGKFPASRLAEHSPLLVSESFSDLNMSAKAREVLQQFVEQCPDSTFKPQVELAAARTYERSQDWPAAVTNYEAWLNHYPSNELQPQVLYALGRANYHAGRESRAFEILTNFVARFRADTNAPLAQWWIADHFSRLGGTNLDEAEKNYELLFQTPEWKGSDLYYQAQLMAGRVAVARKGFPDATNYLVNLLANTNLPASLKAQAMLEYGGVLMRLDSPDTNRPFANFESATNEFGLIIQANPTNEFGAQAGIWLGDCYQQLGALDAATNAYAQVMISPAASVALRNRTQVSLGLTLEKKAALLPPADQAPLLNQALGNYLAVLYADDGADAIWIKEAGLKALPLMVVLKTGDPDKFFDRLEGLLPSLKDALEKKRAALKN